MANPELDWVKSQLQLITLSTQQGLDPELQAAFAQANWEIEREFQAAQAIQADKNASADQKKYAKDVTDSINKNLPNMSKGVLSAVSAFKSGDAMNGTAAIMDICAAGVQLLGSLSAGAGPYGAVFGAVFTIVGQLLTYFGPKQPSMKDQIIDAIKGMDAEQRLRNVQADANVVEEYASTIYRIKTLLPRHLKSPLETKKQLWDFRTDLKADINAIKLAFQKVQTLYRKWDTAEWLKDDATQHHEKWPEILGIFCRTYSDSLIANFALASMADQNLVDKRLNEASNSNPLYSQHSHDFDEVNNLLIKLRALVKAIPEVWNDGNALMQKFVRAVEPVARDRGLFAILGHDGYLYSATGRKALTSGDWKNLSIGYGARGHRFAITGAKPEASAMRQSHHVFFCEHWTASDSGDLEHGRIDAAAVNISGQGAISSDKFQDVWALPSPKDAKASFIYAARRTDSGGSVKLLELDAENKLTEGGWEPAVKCQIANVRAVTHPPAPLTDDPDRDALLKTPLLLGGTDHYNSIVYGGLVGSGEIYVDQSNTRCYVPAPWGDYSGIDVDPYYLWVFRPEGFACATHASVISCIQGQIPAPRWVHCGLDDLLGDQARHVGNKWLVAGMETTTFPRLKGLISLSPCRDGTLFASVHTRTVRRVKSGDHWLFIPDDTLALYTTTYRLAPGSLAVDPWVKCGSTGKQVQKMPVPCWSLLQGLQADLQSAAITRQAR